MATPTFILPSAPTYTEGFVNGLNVYPDPTNFVANQVPFTRATTATRTNAAGLIELTPYNLLTRSEEFASWNLQNVTISSNTATAPNGTLTADKLVPNTSSAQHRIFNIASFSGNGVLSVYAKADGYDFLSFGQGGGTAGDTIIFNLANGTISGTASGYTPVIENAGNGWYRCSISNQSMGGGTSLSYWIVARNANSTADYIGDGTSGIFLWGAQIVEGTAALPYQLTETRLNRPRVDFSLGGCPNLLLEPQRTNLALYSEQFDNASWVKTASTITANSTTSPSGIINADTLLGNGVSSAHSVYQSVSLTSGVNYTISVYAKKGTNNFLQIYGFSTGYGLNTWANFDLNNGVLGSVGSSATPTITSVGNGWYRCTLTFVAAASVSDGFVFNLITSATAARGEVSTLSTSVFLWGAQIESGAYPTTYIPTSSASVTRNQDTFALSNVFTNNMISSAGGTWFVDFRNNAEYIKDSGDRGLFLDTSTTGNTNGFQFVHRNTGGITRRILINKRISGSDTIIYQSSVPLIKIAIKWNGTTADVFANGTKVVNATAFTTTAMEFLNFITDGVPFNINSMALYNTPISDAECIAITS